MKRQLFGRVGGSISAALIVAVLSIAPAMAYTGTGQGTTGNPYKVATCQQLQAINNDLGAHYQQTADIDCADSSTWNSGAGFVPLGDYSHQFTGTFDGQNFAIKNVSVHTDNYTPTGLFGATEGATITHIHVVGGTIHTDPAASSYMGGIVADASHTTISDCSSTAAVEGNWGGGVVGVVYNSTVQRCWFGGTTSLPGYRYTGGIVGLTEDSNLSDLYSYGSFEARGGIAGVIGTGTTIANVYSTAHLQYNETDEVGGLFGSIDGFFDPTAADNIFFDGTIDNAPAASAVGGVVGSLEANATVSAAYFNSAACDCSTGIGVNTGGLGSATGVNGGNTTPDYFKGTIASPPLNTWDFSTVWRINNGSYPTFQAVGPAADGDGDGVVNIAEDAAPGNGDANNDGLPDTAQSNVVSLMNPVSGAYASLATDCDSVTGTAVAPPSTSDVFTYPLGLMSFTLHCLTPGQTATVTQYYYYNKDPGTVVARKYNALSKTYQAIDDATITRTTIGGKPVIQLSYRIADGGPLDQDGQPNGTIVDPSGLATTVMIAPNTGLGGLSAVNE